MKPKILISTGGGDASNYIAAIEAAGGEADARYLPGRSSDRRRLAAFGGPSPKPASGRPTGTVVRRSRMTSPGIGSFLNTGFQSKKV